MTSSPTPAVLPDARALPKLKPGYPDYVDDADGLARFREQVRHGSGHDMAICNNNSLGRLIDTIERLRAERDALATPPARDAADSEVDRLRLALNKIADLGSCSGGKTPAHKLFQQAIDIATGAL